MTDFSIKDTLKQYATRFNQEIERFFPFPEGDEKRVAEAMHYSLTRGGKRLRPYLVYETARLFGISFEGSVNTAMALEMLHTYSLIHDDLPAMDNDDLRRGFPTCHKQFDEATAILAGDGLLTYAFEILSHKKTSDDARIRCQLIQLLAQAAGAFNGMVAGQMLDLLAEKFPEQNSESMIKRIEEMKTGRLIRYACEAGAVLGKATEQERARLVDYSRAIGIAFQIADDILDVEGNQELVGKKLQKDAAQGKLTFVGLYGLDKAKVLAQDYVEKAKDALSIFGQKAETLRLLADFMINRDH